MPSLKTLALLVLVSGCLPAFPAPEIPPEPEPQRDGARSALYATAALVKENGDVYCAGAFYRDHVVTAEHCVDDLLEDDVLVSGYGEVGDDGIATASYVYRVIYHDDVQDLAILKVVAVGPSHVNMEIGPDPVYGQQVVSIGHPVGIPFTMTTGIVSSPLRRLELAGGTMVWTQAETKIYFGNSGGPLMTRDVELIGIASFIAARVPHLGGFSHVTEIRSALRRAGLLE